MIASVRYCSPFGWAFGSVYRQVMRCVYTMCKPFSRKSIQSGSAPIRVVRVVVVDVATRVDIPHVVRVVAVSRPPPTVLRCHSLQPIIFFVPPFLGFSPSLYISNNIIDFVVPVYNPLGSYMVFPFCKFDISF